MRPVTILVVIAACAMFGAAVAEAISSKQFATRASKICKKTQADLRKLSPPAKASDIGRYLKRSINVARPAQRRLEAIPLPKDKRTTARDAVRTARQAMNVMISVSRRIDRGGNPERELAKVQSQIDTIIARQSRLWKKLGATGCA
jgi:hypothetical protein